MMPHALHPFSTRALEGLEWLWNIPGKTPNPIYLIYGIPFMSLPLVGALPCRKSHSPNETKTICWTMNAYKWLNEWWHKITTVRSTVRVFVWAPQWAQNENKEITISNIHFSIRRLIFQKKRKKIKKNTFLFISLCIYYYQIMFIELHKWHRCLGARRPFSNDGSSITLRMVNTERRNHIYLISGRLLSNGESFMFSFSVASVHFLAFRFVII